MTRSAFLFLYGCNTENALLNIRWECTMPAMSSSLWKILYFDLSKNSLTRIHDRTEFYFAANFRTERIT